MHPNITKLESLAETFMKASGFFGGVIGRGTLGKQVRDQMNEQENTEFGWEIPRRNIHWAEFFSKVAARQGLLNEAAALVPVEKVEADTISTLLQINMPQFALVVSTAQRLKH